MNRRLTLSSRRCRGDRGTVLETVIMVPLILWMVMLVAQFAIAAYTKQVLTGAVEDGAAEAALLHSSDARGQATAESLFASADGWVSAHNIDVSRDDRQVVATGEATVVKIFPLLPTITVQASSAASIEQWEAP